MHVLAADNTGVGRYLSAAVRRDFGMPQRTAVRQQSVYRFAGVFLHASGRRLMEMRSNMPHWHNLHLLPHLRSQRGLRPGIRPLGLATAAMTS